MSIRIPISMITNPYYLISFFFLIFLVVSSEEVIASKIDEHFDDGSAETRCSRHGPSIRFPFSLNSRRNIGSGYHGFELSCTNQRDTVLQLPHGGGFLVTEINYMRQEIRVSDPDGCIVRRLLHLNLSSSPFSQIKDGSYYYDSNLLTIFNCSTTNNDILHVAQDYSAVPINCLNVRGYRVFAVQGTLDSVPLTSCTAVETTILPIPPPKDRYFFREEDLNSQSSQTRLNWSLPRCSHCEAHGQRCRLKERSIGSPDKDLNETECFFVPNTHARERDYEKIAKKLSIVGLWCIQWYPVDRPSISSVIQMLEGETENLTIPPNPFASTTTLEKNTGNIRERPRDYHALSIISEHDELE
ncbi:hypothetical protein Sjap_021103 [Stephania japonica]|uniref:RING-type E3 ubiquitin transferase n=1 Tax=Stephania japonica TaxID=461633 RepID=A0AAP0F2X0_9MAGN